MAEERFLLLDVDHGVALDAFELRPTAELSLAGADDWWIRLFTLRGGISDGVQVLEVCNGPLTLSLLPTRGMGVWKARYHDLPVEWQSPVRRPVHPTWVNLTERHGLGWLSGFNELMCRCGLAWMGPPGDDQGESLTLHGRIANLPAHRLEIAVDREGPGTLWVRGEVDESSLFGPNLRLVTTLTLKAGANLCSFVDEIINLGGTAQEISLLYHINIGRPLLEPGAETCIAYRESAPRDLVSGEGVLDQHRYGFPTPGVTEQAFYYKPVAGACGWTTALLKNASNTAGFAVHYQTLQLPCFTVWKNPQHEADGYVTGLEPGIQFPNFKAYERQQGRIPSLLPGHRYRAEMMWEFADHSDAVQRLEQDVELAQRFARRVNHARPQPGWSPAGDV
ncbi:MAG: DUF4432 domain-containing protein [Planctomycetaceae bacterium]|nr:MAG: DUF4432 domain-containing protein [Planctomycetaceae bacterium]